MPAGLAARALDIQARCLLRVKGACAHKPIPKMPLGTHARCNFHAAGAARARQRHIKTGVARSTESQQTSPREPQQARRHRGISQPASGR